jgi:hypothetical protein
MPNFLRIGFLLACLFLLNRKSSYSQTPADSVFLNTIMQEPVYSAYWLSPGNWFLYDSVNTTPALYSFIDSLFIFENEDFPNAYAQIAITNSPTLHGTVNTTMNNYFNQNPIFAYQQADPLYYLDFNLNQKMGRSEFTFSSQVTTPTSQRTAFLIIPGSNTNQTTELIRGTGYHNNLCQVKNLLRNHGDVYIHTKPGEDYRALVRKRKKLNTGDYYTPGAPSFLYNYLLSNNKPYAVNYILECFAMIKYLHSDYDKVVVLGCSLGGFSTLISAINTPVDGCLISSGYSINFNNSPADLYSLQQNFGSVITGLTDTVVKSEVLKTNTDYLFTYGNNDSQWYQLEHDSHPTEQYFGANDHVSFFYNYTGHNFPPCNIIDSFLQGVLTRPKIKLSDVAQCKTDSMVIPVRVVGKFPIQAALYHNSSLLQQVVFTTNDTTLTVYNEGAYYFKQVQDSALVVGFNSDTLHFIKDTLSASSPVLTAVECATGNHQFSLAVNVDTRTTAQVHYRINGNPTVNGVVHGNNTLLLPNYQLTHFDSITTAQGCTLGLHDSVFINWNHLQFNTASPGYVCSSDSATVALQASGGYSPYTIQYLANGVQDSVFMSNSLTKAFAQGNYQFLQITDSMGCSASIGSALNINLQPLDIQVGTPSYVCTQQQYELPLVLDGNPPFTLHYRHNGIAQQITTSNLTYNWMLSAGSYDLDSLNDATCRITFGSNYHYDLNYIPLQVYRSPSYYNCAHAITYVDVQVIGGASPFQLNYTYDGAPVGEALLAGWNTLSLPNGVFNFLSVTDSQGCTQALNGVELVNNQAAGIQFSTPSYQCDSLKIQMEIQLSGIPPFQLFYRKNNQPKLYVTNDATINLLFENGLYQFDSLQDNRCSIPIDTVHHYVFAIDPLSITQTPTWEYDCSNNQTYINLEVQGGKQPYQFHLFKNGIADTLFPQPGYNHLAVSSGSYQCIQLTDSLGCTIPDFTFLAIDRDSLSATVNYSGYNCTSQLHPLQLSLQGMPPFQVFYSFNGMSYSFITNTYDTLLTFINGVFQLDSIQDIQCSWIPSQIISFTWNQIPLQLVSLHSEFNCDSNAEEVQILLSGNSPFTYSIIKNNIPFAVTYSSNSMDTFLSNGNYYLQQVTDGNGCAMPINEGWQVNHDALTFNVSNPVFLCDSNTTLLEFHFTGEPPYTLYYRKNGNATSYTTSTESVDLFFENGYYQFDSLTDMRCSLSLNVNRTINYQPLQLQFGNSSYECDSNKIKIPLTIQGNYPMRLRFVRNNISDSVALYQPVSELFLPTGNYFFYEVINAFGCIQPLNHSIAGNYSSLSASHTSPKYNCTLQKNEMEFSLQGNPPFVITYTVNGNTFNPVENSYSSVVRVENGSIQLVKITDATGCEKPLGASYSLNNAVPLNAQLISNSYRCDIQKQEVKIKTSGYKPFTVFYHRTDSAMNASTVLSTADTISMLFTKGNYRIDSIKDFNGCSQIINENIINSNDPLTLTIISANYACDSAKQKISIAMEGIAPFTLRYHKVGNAMQEVVTGLNTLNLFFDQGNYIIDSLKDARCALSPQININQPISPLQVTVGTPTLHCDSMRYNVEVQTSGGLLPITLHYLENGSPKNYKLISNNDSIFLNNNTNYVVQYIQDSLGCTQTINQFINTDLEVPYCDSITSQYDCDKDSTAITLHTNLTQGNIFTYQEVQGSPKNIALNGNPFYIPAGVYTWKNIQWGNGCLFELNQKDTIANQQLKFTLGNAVTNCSLLQTGFPIQVEGKAPWSLQYIWNDSLYQRTLVKNIDTLYWPMGYFTLLYIKDGNQCMDTVLQSILSPQLLNYVPQLTLVNQELVANYPNARYQWYWNDSLQSNINSTFSIQGNGVYHVDLVDDFGCTYRSNSITVNLPDDVSVYPNPITDQLNIFVNRPFEFWEYALYDVYGNKIKSGLHDKPALSISTHSLAAGTYLLHVKDGSNSLIFKIMKL